VSAVILSVVCIIFLGKPGRYSRQCAGGLTNVFDFHLLKGVDRRV